MAAETIISLRKPGFPKVDKSENSTTTRIEYIGAKSTLEAEEPGVGVAWGDYAGQVKSTSVEPTEDSTISELFITLEATIDNETVDTGTLASVSYEIRWVKVDRPLLEHPQFADGQGGANALTGFDQYDIERWRDPENSQSAYKDFKYQVEGGGEDSAIELSTNAKLFAQGIKLGQETWEDRAPIAIKISEYVGGPPPETNAGLKEGTPAIPNIPTGYEWRKETADSTRAGGETRWTLTEEWHGAKFVLIDRDRVFWAAP